MRRILALVIVALTMLTLSSCFLFGVSLPPTTTHPDMVEYTEEEILKIAGQKYGVTRWIFTGNDLRGDAEYNAEGVFCVKLYEQQFSADFVNGSNVEAALQAFAGKNGGHDVQGMYESFLCYVALAECADGSLKFIHYNTNLHKDAKISDTIGASDYTFEVSPEEITDSLFEIPSYWHQNNLDLNNHFKSLTPKGLDYSGERLSASYHDRYGGLSEAEFYKENGGIVLDLYYTRDHSKSDERRIVYSTSERYGVIRNYYGLDISQYFDITKTVTQSPDEQNVMVLWGSVKEKELDGEVLYSRVGYRAEYQVLRNGEIMTYESTDTVIDKLSFERGYGIEKIDGVDHTETAKFSITNFYIFYEKTNDAE